MKVKSPAVLISLLVPGGGQVYNGHYVLGITLGLASALTLFFGTAMYLIGLPYALAVWFYALLHAYLNARPEPAPRPKSPGWAVLISLFVIGGGQIYNGHYRKGMSMGLIFSVSLFLASLGTHALWDWLLVVPPATWALGIVDTIVYSRRSNYAPVMPKSTGPI
ncbi:MAG: hypothetical protein M1598_02470 [Actinobacteria bacterium]|nr:hypothetical protein [Actinomycetota bacterium]